MSIKSITELKLVRDVVVEKARLIMAGPVSYTFYIQARIIRDIVM